MNDITTNQQEYTPAPQRDRRGHIPAAGDIYFNKDTHYPTILRLTGIKEEGSYRRCECEEYNLLENNWEKARSRSDNELKEYYALLLNDLEEVLAIARKAIGGDYSALNALLNEADDTPQTMALMTSRPAEQVLSVTEKAERLEDKISTVKNCMNMIISAMRAQMEARVDAVKKKLSRVQDYVQNLQRIITVMNLYTGQSVDVTVICDGAKAPSAEPIHVRQRILFMDEEYLADAENGGIDYEKTDVFCDWLRKPANRDIVLPESKCIVAMKPKRYDKEYSRDYYLNKELNAWNHHTLIVIRDGERLFLIDSDDLELYGTAIPYSDQAERFQKRYDALSEGGRRVYESDLAAIKKESEALGFMYLKYISFLQGMVDSGKIFDLSQGRPNFAKEEGVVYVYDDEMAVGTGRDWESFRNSLNKEIRRGTRILFSPKAQDGRYSGVSCGKPNRTYWHEDSIPRCPSAGVYNVDYPTKTNYVKNPSTGRYESVTVKGERLAIFYTPARTWKWNDDAADRRETWLYNPDFCINYDLLTVEAIDAFMADRTQRASFRGWMPLLQEARKHLLKEKADEDAFKNALGWEILKENPDIYQECLPGLLDESIDWWKRKVIFTRPLTSDDAKAWRMIKGRVKQVWKKEKS